MSFLDSATRWLGPESVHPLVRLNLNIRTPAFLTPIAILATVFAERGAPPLWWALTIALSLGWPYIAYALAANRPNYEAQKRAEHRNLYIDAILIGASIGATGLNPWGCIAGITIIITASAVVGGLRMVISTLLVTGLVSVTVAIGTGLGFHPETAWATVAVSMVCVTAFTLSLSLAQRSLTRTAIQRGKQLKAQNVQIEAHSAELAEARAAAEAAATAARQANETKSQFLANMSHELRTPLNAIIGYSEMLAEDAEDEGNAEIVLDLEKIRGAGKHLLGLINDVLDLSKVEAGKMEIHAEGFDPREMVAGVVATVQPLVQQKANTLVVATEGLPGSMRSDLTKVRQILFNLLSNASKFTESGTITLSGWVEEDVAVFEVRDTGIGMTEAQVGKLFQPFVQADASTTRKYGGTGLGLTISRRFAELLGGGIEVASDEGEGTIFTVRLALDATESAAEPGVAPGAAPVALEPLGLSIARAGNTFDGEGSLGDTTPLVLVIDDDDNSRDILAQTLRRSGLRTLQAADGETGLALAREYAPDLITLDVLMPGTDGWSVLRQLKAAPETADIPVVLATITDNRAMGYALGAVGYVTKPFERSELVQAVRQHLREAEASVILVVEDDLRTSELLRRNIEREGWVICEAATVGEALASLKESEPSLVLLDLLLPDGSGFDVLEALETLGSNVPVVVFTAKDLSAADRSRLSGHVEHIFQKGRAAQNDILAEIRRLLPGPEVVMKAESIPGA